MKHDPTRFNGTFTIPMHPMDAAMKELDYSVTKLDLRIANVSHFPRLDVLRRRSPVPASRFRRKEITGS